MSYTDDAKKIIYATLKKNGITMDMITQEKALIGDLGADSLDVIELMLAFEEHTGCIIDERNLSKLVTVGDIVGLLNPERGDVTLGRPQTAPITRES
jgi:acyl carrier protein